MKNNHHLIQFRLLFVLTFLLFFSYIQAQGPSNIPKSSPNFWENVQFGGGLGLSIGSGYTDISISPSAIYNINSIVAVGTALQFGYVSSKNYYTSKIYGGSLIGLINPINEIQLSAELEEIKVSTNYKSSGANYSGSFWNTSLYLGAGYRTGNVTIGVRYNVLYDKNKSYYNDPFMPFVRVYF